MEWDFKDFVYIDALFSREKRNAQGYDNDEDYKKVRMILNLY